MLAVRQLGVRFGNRRPVDGLNLDVASGETVGLIGASGSGKSLTASVICGLPPIGATVTGAIRLGDGRGGTVEIGAAPERQLARLRGRCVALVGQDALTALNPLSSIGSQLAVPLRRHQPARATRRRHTLWAAGIELLATVGLSDPERVWRAYPTQLSGGQRQRVAVALAVACRPRLLVADEPTSALDPTAQAGVLALLSQLPASGAQPPSLLLISHDLATVAQVCRRVYVLHDGRAVETGPTRQVLGAPRHPFTRQLVAAAHTLSLAPAPGRAS